MLSAVNHYYKNILHWKSSYLRLFFSVIIIILCFIAGAYPDSFITEDNDQSRLFLMLLPFCTGLAGLYLVFRFLHHADFSKLFIPDGILKISVKRIFFGFFLWLAIQIFLEIIMFMLNPDDYSFQYDLPVSWLWLVLVALLMIPVQTSFEELFVRSYLLQYFYKFFDKKFVALCSSSVFFAILHYSNPEIVEYGAGIMLFYYFLAGLGIGLISYFDNRMELALGMHASNNIYAAVLVSYKKAAFDTQPLIEVSSMNVFASIALFLIGIFIFLLICKYNYKWVLP